MRLKVHSATANEELIYLINQGYEALASADVEYRRRKLENIFDDARDVSQIFSEFNKWIGNVIQSLIRIFPTELEAHIFRDPEISMGTVVGDVNYQCAMRRGKYFVRGLNQIRLQSLPEYTDLPLDARLFVENIDSFRKVRDINPAMVSGKLHNGFLNVSEDCVQTAFERILDVPFHKKDWGGEQNDLYTANLVINGARCETAFMLKGNGLKVPKMEIKHCGANGDQLLRLCSSPAKLFIVQFVGNISEAVVSDIDGKIRQARAQGRDAWYCLIDGQDTARILLAYGQLQ